MIKAIITDIEGTTTSVSFVYDVLFPYARERMSEFVLKNIKTKEVMSQLEDVIKLANIDNQPEEIIRQLMLWMDEDKKITPLKALQGMIWKAGYDSGDLKGHIYDDVVPVLKQWKEQMICLYVYSSGSVSAQKLLFGHSDQGNLNSLFSGYFDTRVGNKREVGSYKQILNEIDLPGNKVLFLSDVAEELDAASKAGIHTIQLLREGIESTNQHKSVNSFFQIELDMFTSEDD